MNNQNKILYEHLKDYPISTEGFHDIGNRAVAAALYSEHMPDVPERGLRYALNPPCGIARDKPK